ncbi:hypothetical protein QQ397_13470, partial [Enterococcus faecium]|nr:hypothetical protein [Enterococcus faecium]MDW0326750.1 hypothetical protein [Enterococcus faecium]
QSINQSKITKNLSQNEVHSDPDLILYNPSVLIDKEPLFLPERRMLSALSAIDSVRRTEKFMPALLPSLSAH